jgi:uncharacterized LabA/DUF88 family protein
MSEAVPSIRAALFVDFDNIYRALLDADASAAARFARQPAQWLSWFAKGLHQENEAQLVPRTRSILVRRCYLSPHAYGEFRPFYTRAGFSAIDCPALTGRGKNSADIVLVMDMIDALEHQTRFDEFIILSGDADFTPVLLRLRAYDRRTVVVTNALTAAAYRAASDISVRQETFIEDALGIEEVVPHSEKILSAGADRARQAPHPINRREQILEFVRQELTSSDTPIQGAHLGNVLIRQLKFNFKETDWEGAGTLRELLLSANDPHIAVHTIQHPAGNTSMLVYDPTRHSISEEGIEYPTIYQPLSELIEKVTSVTGPGSSDGSLDPRLCA